MKKIFTVLTVLLLVFSSFLNIQAAEPTGCAYFYNDDNKAVSCPLPYTVSNIFGYDLGLQSPCDMMVYGNNLYILDSGNGRIVVLDSDYNMNRSFGLSLDGKSYSLQEPKSIWIDNNEIFIADRSGQAVIRCDMTGNIKKIYTQPVKQSDTSANDFLPTDVITDHQGNIYVMVENEYRGLVVMDADGNFKGYFGANTVETTYNVIMDNLWRTYFLSEKQIESSNRNLPSPYISVSAKDGFIFASSSGDSNKIRKLNYNGNNILSPSASSGDCDTESDSRFVSVVADDQGFYTAIDSNKKMIFQYDSEGNLLYAFGGVGNVSGCFIEPVSIVAMGDKLLVLDSSTCSVTVFTPSEFGSSVRSLRSYVILGKYNEASEKAKQTLGLCNEYEMANYSLGEYEYSNGNYSQAMNYFRSCSNQKGYSKAFEGKRIEVMKKAFPYVVSCIFAIVILFYLLKRHRKKNNEQPPSIQRIDPTGKIKYAFYTVLHPIEGYSELHYNQRYSLAFANSLYFLSFFVSMLNFIFTGYCFSTKNATDFNLLLQLAQTVGVLSLFVISNWLVATFLNGIGRLKEIWIAVGYAQIPIIIGNAIFTVLSNVLTADEGVFLGYLLVIAMAYTYIMMLFAVMGIHMYSFKDALISIVCTVFGMLVSVFILFLLFNLLVELFGFFKTISGEIIYRLSV